MDLPVLVMHGDADRIVPYVSSAAVPGKTLKRAI